MPMTSPVLFISGPRCVSTPVSLDIENTGALMATSFRTGHSPPWYPCCFKLCPSITRVATFTIGTPVTFDIKGTVRLALGLTSIT